MNRIDENGSWSRWITITLMVSAVVIGVAALATGNVALAAGAAKAAFCFAVALNLQSFHYDLRKTANENVPNTLEKTNNTGEITNISSACHNFTTPIGDYHLKVCWKDGREGIYSKRTGERITNSIDGGSFNFYVPEDNDLAAQVCHGIFDVLPWVIFGNDDDPGPIFNFPKKWITRGF